MKLISFYHNNKAFLLLFFLFNSCQMAGQSGNDIDTSIILSITIFNKKENRKNLHFPDVYPNISRLYFTNTQDSVFCIYKFPFLLISKDGYEKIKSQTNISLEFYYDHINSKFNKRFLLSIPVRFPLTYNGAKFIVIERDNRNAFFGMQKWGSTIFTGEKIKSTLIY